MTDAVNGPLDQALVAGVLNQESRDTSASIASSAPQISPAEIAAGTGTSIRSTTPADLTAFVAQHESLTPVLSVNSKTGAPVLQETDIPLANYADLGLTNVATQGDANAIFQAVKSFPIIPASQATSSIANALKLISALYLSPCDLGLAVSVRLRAFVSSLTLGSNSKITLVARYSLDNGSNFSTLCSTDVTAANQQFGSWVSIPSGAKADCLVEVRALGDNVGGGGSITTSNITLESKRT